jgi:hypothetical protein
MIRILIPCLLLVSGLPVAAQTPAEQKPPVEQKAPADAKLAVVMCVYNSKNYSEGASVCVQKAVMQTCTVDGTKATWVTVTDEKLSSRCTAPGPRLNKYQRAAIWNRRNIAREISPPTNGSASCINTGGLRFCD